MKFDSIISYFNPLTLIEFNLWRDQTVSLYLVIEKKRYCQGFEVPTDLEPSIGLKI